MDVRNHAYLVHKRGWSIEQYRRWYVDTVAAVRLTHAIGHDSHY